MSRQTLEQRKALHRSKMERKRQDRERRSRRAAALHEYRKSPVGSRLRAMWAAVVNRLSSQ